MNEKIKPGRWLYVLAGFILAAGITGFVIMLVTGILGVGQSFKQVVVPGESELYLDQAGNYTIFHEYRSVVDGKIYNTSSSLSGLQCTIVDKSNNSKLPMSVSWSNSKYEIGNREGVSVFEFKIDKPGIYILSANYDQNSDMQKTVLAIGRDFGGNLLGLIFGAIAILFVSIAAFITIIVLTYRKRRNCRLGLQGKFL